MLNNGEGGVFHLRDGFSSVDDGKSGWCFYKLPLGSFLEEKTSIFLAG